MDQVFFSFKRTHHAGLRFLRATLEEFGLTPARFDMLSAIRRDFMQSGVQRILGLARATVSEMLARLEELGLVRRKRYRRTKAIWLTAKGRELFRQAQMACVNSGYVPISVDGALTQRDADVDPLIKRFDVEAICGAMRRAFGDRAKSDLYLWHPDEYLDALIFEGDPDALERFSPSRHPP